MKIQLKILNPRIDDIFPLPQRETLGSAGVDLRACIDNPIMFRPGDCHLIPTGIAIYIHEPYVAGMILPRSGLGHKYGLILGNGTGLIDPDYQGELKVSLWRRSASNGIEYVVNPGDRIAQLMLVPILVPQFDIVEEFEESARGAGGFGHTGK